MVQQVQVPFIVSQSGGRTDADVSQITSPFEEVNRALAYSQHGSSLFARLSRASLESPTLTPTVHFDALSTINAEDSLCEKHESDRCNRQCGPTRYDHQSNNDSRESPIPILRRVQGIGADSFDNDINDTRDSSYKEQLHTESDLSKSSFNYTEKLSRQLEASMITASTKSSKDNEWREVQDPESGRTYYYNRVSRVSKWKLPEGGILVKKKKAVSSRPRSDHQRTEHTSMSDSQLNDSKCIYTSDSRDKDSQIKTPQTPSVVRQQQLSDTSSQDSYSVDTSYGSQSNDVVNGKLDLKESDAAAQARNDDIASAIHLKSPQDCDADAIFCLYCGLSTSVALLESHVPKCPAFIHMKMYQQSTQMELESILFKTWSLIGSSTETSTAIVHKHVPSSSAHHSFRHNNEQDGASSLSHGNEQIQTVGTSYETFSDDEPYEGNLKTPTQRKMRKEVNEHAFCVEKKKCPFCSNGFDKGNEFSSHLLRCRERKKARKHRRTKKKDNPLVYSDPRIRKPVTPGRQMPWE